LLRWKSGSVSSRGCGLKTRYCLVLSGVFAGTGTVRGHNKVLLKSPTKATELHHEVLSYVKETNSDLPVTNVNWFDAQDYVRWLSTQTGHTYRLLTEAEWEYACRAGSVTEYYWGDEIGHNNCNCQDSESEWSCKSASPVGSFKPNAFGLYDMLGNAWEWVEDHGMKITKGLRTTGRLGCPKETAVARVTRRLLG